MAKEIRKQKQQWLCILLNKEMNPVGLDSPVSVLLSGVVLGKMCVCVSMLSPLIVKRGDFTRYCTAQANTHTNMHLHIPTCTNWFTRGGSEWRLKERGDVSA